jgi:hypothetical protein
VRPITGKDAQEFCKRGDSGGQMDVPVPSDKSDANESKEMAVPVTEPDKSNPDGSQVPSSNAFGSDKSDVDETDIVGEPFGHSPYPLSHLLIPA